ncbi:MAG: alpha/beta fold hydrolase [Pseudomonadota bacterium]
MTPLWATGAVSLTVGGLWYGLRRYQNSQLFKPTRARGPLSPNPAEKGVPFESVRFGSQGRLHGWFLPRDPKADTLLFCHGNRGNLSDRVGSCLLYHELGFNVFALDYRGYGLSAGRPSEAGLYDDAHEAWRYLVVQRHIPAARLVLLGRSLGGAIASHLATRVTPAAVVIEATFKSVLDLAREHYPNLPTWGLGRMQFDNVARIGKINSPLLLVHSKDDTVINIAHAEALHAKAPPGTELVRIIGEHSNGHITSGDRYTEPLVRFLDQCGVRRVPIQGVAHRNV